MPHNEKLVTTWRGKTTGLFPILRRFRKVEISKHLQRTFAVPEFICADPEGMPFLEGQGFYAWLIDEMGCRPLTASNYLKSVLQFLTFLWFRSLSYAAPVLQVRENIETYFRDKLGCVIRPHREGNLLITRSNMVTRSTIRLYMVALKRFYDYLIQEGKYTGINPLSWPKSREAAIGGNFVSIWYVCV